MEVVLPTGEIVEIGEGGGRKLRKSSTAFNLKQLFTGHQGTLGICTEATLELAPRPEVEFAAFFAFDDYMKAWETTGILTKSGLATIAGVVLFDEWKIAYLRRDDEAYIPQPDSVRAVVAVAMYGSRAEVEPASKVIMRLGRSKRRQVPRRRDLRRRLGVAPRPLRDAAARPRQGRPGRDDVLALRGRRAELLRAPAGARGVARDRRRATASATASSTTGACSPTPAAPTSRGRDYLVEIDVGIWEQQLDDENWAAWVDCKREISEVTLKYGGSITACHGATRAGDAELVPTRWAARGRS